MQAIPLPRRSRAQADGEPSPRRGSAEGRYTPPSEDLIHVTRVDTLIKGVRNVIPEQQSRIETGDTLWCAGDLSLVKKPCIAIVGTRQVSSEGAARSRRLARELVERGIVVVSGLAKGVDTEALTSAIEHGGRVIAVIGTPIDRAYPAENKHLQEKIYREHLLISQFAPGERVFPSNFPERNKLMAAVSDGTAIIEAGETSGTLHQAAECVRLGRWLFLAKSVVDNPKLEWPKKFVSYPHYVALKTTQDILEAIRVQDS
jgi:DNA processing protein